MKLFFFIHCFVIFVSKAICLRILIIPAHSSASHTKSMYPMAETLAKAGHQVVVWQILSDETQKASNKLFENRYLITNSTKDVPTASNFNAGGFFWSSSTKLSISFIFPWIVMTTPCTEVLESNETRSSFMDTVTEHWDYIFVDNVFSACGYLAAQLNGAPFIDFATSTCIPTCQDFKGAPIWPSVVPSSKLDGSTDLTYFTSRLLNSLDMWVINGIVHSMDYYLRSALVHEIARNLSFSDFQKNSAFNIISFAPELEIGKPMIHNMLEIDSNCPGMQTLPEPYKSFVENPKSKGTILLAFGHLLQWDTAPEEVKTAFHGALEELRDYRIIWQYGTSDSANRPKTSDHIMLSEWIPQYAILTHPKTLAFISHLGAKSFRETVCAKVPVISMPMFAEQFRNSAIIRYKKIGVFLGKLNLTKGKVHNAIQSVITNDVYKRNIVKLQDQLNDKIMNPLELAEWWLRFVHRKPYAVRWMKHRKVSNSLLRFNMDFEMISLILSVLIAFKIVH